MKIEKTNNPAAAAALIVVLVLIVGRIVWMLFGQSGSASAASHVAVTPAVPSAHPTPIVTPSPRSETLPASPVTTALPTTTRNPFMRVAPPKAASFQTRSGDSRKGRTAISFMPLPPMPIHAMGNLRPGGQGAFLTPLPGLTAPPVKAGQGVSVETAAKVSPPPDPTQSLKLTALVEGAQPMAVVQTLRPEPVVLHIGDKLEGMRVAAINEQGVVLVQGKSRWTLTLQSSTNDATTGAVSVTSVDVPQEKTDEQQ